MKKTLNKRDKIPQHIIGVMMLKKTCYIRSYKLIYTEYCKQWLTFNIISTRTITTTVSHSKNILTIIIHQKQQQKNCFLMMELNYTSRQIMNEQFGRQRSINHTDKLA